jgi:hypothetical protein
MLVKSWLAYYAAMPFTGAILGLVFYVVVRAGFIAPNGDGAESPYGFVAVAMLVGLFSQQAVLKLKSVADLVFTEPGEGKNSKPQSSGTPTPPPPIAIEKVYVARTGSPSPALVVVGRGFADGCTVKIDGKERTGVRWSERELRLPLDSADEAALSSTHEVVVTNPDGSSASISTTFDAPAPKATP